MNAATARRACSRSSAFQISAKARFAAERTGLPVVSDLRARDVAAGGQGAPMTSTLDLLWLAGPGGPRAALNLGGIAHVSIVGDEDEPVSAVPPPARPRFVHRSPATAPDLADLEVRRRTADPS